MPNSLQIHPCSIKFARKFIAKHHSYLPRVVGGIFALATLQSQELVAVALVGRPRNVHLSRLCIAELYRLAVQPNAMHAASFLLARTAKAAFALGYDAIISYVPSKLDATSYRAAGWNPEKRHRAKGWHGRELPPDYPKEVIRWQLNRKTTPRNSPIAALQSQESSDCGLAIAGQLELDFTLA